MLERLQIIVALFAALAVTILSLYQDITFYELSKRLVVVIPAFFVLGLFFRAYFKKLFAPPEAPPEEKADVESTEEQGELQEENQNQADTAGEDSV